MTLMMPPSPATSISSFQSYRGHHSRNSSESLLFTPPLSPTEEQLLAFLIPDIEPSELAAYLSAPTTPLMSDVSCLIGKNTVKQAQAPSFYSTEVEAVYPSPVCAAAAATVVALDRLDSQETESIVSLDVFSAPALRRSNKRCSTFAFMDADHDQEETKEMDETSSSDDFSSSPVYVMSSRNTRKRLMLEQAFVSPEDNEESHQNCYAQLFQGATSDDETDLSQDLSDTLAFDLILV